MTARGRHRRPRRASASRTSRSPEENSTVAEDIVHRTDPVAGTIVVENQVITLYYNPRKELQEVPNVEGQPLEEAQRILSAAGFQIGHDHARGERHDRRELGHPHRPAGRRAGRAGHDDQPRRVVRARPAGACRRSSSGGPRPTPASCWRTRRTASSSRHDGGDQRRRRRAGHPHQPVGRHARRHRRLDHARRVERRPGRRRAQRVGQTEARGPQPAVGSSTSACRTRTSPAGDGNDGRVIAQSIAGGQQAPAGSSIQLTVGRAAAATADDRADDDRRADHDRARPRPRPRSRRPPPPPGPDGRLPATATAGLGITVRSMGDCRASGPSCGSPPALLIGYVVWKTGIAMLRSLTRALPPPPPPGEMRKMNLRYRCDVCGVELS